MKTQCYYEMPFKSAIKVFPHLLFTLPKELLSDFLNDDKYVVRITQDGSYFEFGYPDDEWTIC